MNLDNLIPQVKYTATDYLKMLKDLFPFGPAWNFTIRPAEYTDGGFWQTKTQVPNFGPSGTFGVLCSIYVEPYLYFADGDAVLWRWDGANIPEIAAPAFPSVNLVYGLEYYDGKIYGGTGFNGILLEHIIGSGVWAQAAPELNGQNDLFCLRVFNDLLYIGTKAPSTPGGGRLLVYDKNAPGAMAEVAPKLTENEIHFLQVYNGELYGCTGTNAQIYKWNGVNAWTSFAPQFDSEDIAFGFAWYNDILYCGFNPGGRLAKWTGSAWQEIYLPDELSTESSIHFFLEGDDGFLYVSTLNNGYLLRIDKLGNVTIAAGPTGTAITNLVNRNGAVVGVDGTSAVLKNDVVPSSVLGKLMTAFARELARFEQSFTDLIRESVPGLSVDLLPDWEEVAGLPEPCIAQGSTIEERQEAVHAKIYSKYSGLSEQFYIDYATSLGIEIEIDPVIDSNLFRVSNKDSDLGLPDPRQRVSQMPTLGIDGSRLRSDAAIHSWTVTVYGTQEQADIIECKFNTLKPVWTVVTVQVAP